MAASDQALQLPREPKTWQQDLGSVGYHSYIITCFKPGWACPYEHQKQFWQESRWGYTAPCFFSLKTRLSYKSWSWKTLIFSDHACTTAQGRSYWIHMWNGRNCAHFFVSWFGYYSSPPGRAHHRAVDCRVTCQPMYMMQREGLWQNNFLTEGCGCSLQSQ